MSFNCREVPPASPEMLSAAAVELLEAILSAFTPPLGIMPERSVPEGMVSR